MLEEPCIDWINASDDKLCIIIECQVKKEHHPCFSALQILLKNDLCALDSDIHIASLYKVLDAGDLQNFVEETIE